MKHRQRLIALALIAKLWALTSHAAERSFAVPSVTIYPGDIIAESQVVERVFPQSVAGKYPAIEQRELVVGKVARRTLLPGRPIPANGIKDPDAISRGGTVLAVYRVGTLTITSHVTPLRSGVVGEIIEARNLDSGQIIRGEVQADGTLKVGVAR